MPTVRVSEVTHDSPSFSRVEAGGACREGVGGGGLGRAGPCAKISRHRQRAGRINGVGSENGGLMFAPSRVYRQSRDKV